MRTEMIYIAEDGKRFNNVLDCIIHEKGLKELKEMQSRNACDEFLKSIGFDAGRFNSELEKNQAIDITWLVFDASGNFVGLKTCGDGTLNRYGIACDFKYTLGNSDDDTETMGSWLQKNKFYAHRLCSFVDRNVEFYKMDFIKMLECLGWTFETTETGKRVVRF